MSSSSIEVVFVCVACAPKVIEMRSRDRERVMAILKALEVHEIDFEQAREGVRAGWPAVEPKEMRERARRWEKERRAALVAEIERDSRLEDLLIKARAALRAVDIAGDYRDLVYEIGDEVDA